MNENEKRNTGMNSTVNTNNKEDKMQDSAKHEKMAELIEGIKKKHKQIEKGERKTDDAAREIGKSLLKIEKEKLFKLDTDKKGKAIKNMAKFIKKNFSFTFQYGSMLKQSAKVQEILELNDDISFRLLRQLNRYTKEPETLKAIWQTAIQNNDNKTPNTEQLEKAIKNWKEKHPDEHQTDDKTKKSLDRILNDESTSLKEIGSVLAKIDPSTISEEEGINLIEKIKSMLNHQKNEAVA